MHDSALRHAREVFHRRLGRHGTVDQVRAAGQLFAGDYSSASTVGNEFGDSLLGLGVMEDLAGEVVSLGGRTWRVPPDGIPVPVDDAESVAFGIAAHGGRRHRVRVPKGVPVDGLLDVIDTYLERHHVDHEQVVCALRVRGTFSDVVLRTVCPPTFAGESLGQIIDDEVRFRFASWSGALVGFRFPDTTDGETIPGLHLHGISDDRDSGGHLRNMVSDEVVMDIWIDELHAVTDSGRAATAASTTHVDFARFEGPVRD
ncbi:MAG: acetolactate decarboxylase [Ilumatobacteraceae bacterium]|jgi:acetolactate decarboxylase